MSRKKRILISTEFSGLNTGYACIARNLLRKFHESGKYEIFEHARYCKGSDPYHAQLIKQIPWKVYPNMPENDREEQIYRSHPANEFGRWKWDWVCLETKPDIVVDWSDFWMCLTKHSPIQTINGIIEIQDIKNGDMVLTHKGRYRKVINTFKRNHNGNFITLTTSNNSRQIKLTERHPILCIKRKNIYSFCPTYINYQHISNKAIPDLDVSPEWVNSDDVETGDLVCVPLQTEQTNNFDLDLARLIGYYAAEGCLLYRKKNNERCVYGIQFVFHKDENEYIEDIKHIVNKHFGAHISLKIVGSNKNAARVRIFNKDIANLMISNIPGLSGTKTLSQNIFNANILVQQQFLTGLLRGDGGFDDNRGYYCTKSRNLAYQVFQMCLNNNIMPAMGYNKNKLKGETFYRYIFSFSGESFNNFKEIYNQTYKFNLEQKIQNNYGWFYIKKVEKSVECEDVYNFEVEEDNSYVSTITLHNCNFIDQSPFRKFYKTVMMPTVDSISQNEEWLDLYLRTDHVFTYTNFAYKVLREEGGGLIPLCGVTTPAVDTNIYKFSGDRRKHKESLGIDPDSIIIGMVARNQRRKLYPDFGEAFAEFIKKSDFQNTKNVYLYWHCSHPDLGWNIPKYIKDSGLSHKVLMTYHCHKCKNWFPSFYQDSSTLCKFCGEKSALLSNSSVGVDNNALANIYNLMDLYIQFITNEGLGIPCLEAAACGCPIAATYYSGTEDLVDNLQGYKINPRTLFHEAETSRQLSLPSIDDLVNHINEFVSLPETIRYKMSVKTAALAQKFYGGWDGMANKWMEIFDQIEISPQNLWETTPIDIMNVEGIQPPTPQQMNDEQFILWCLERILHRSDWTNSYAGLKMMRDLGWFRMVQNTLGFFFGELSQLSQKPTYEQCNRSTIMKMVTDQRNTINNAEQMRYQYLQEGKLKYEMV